jgi:hypothetical protein
LRMGAMGRRGLYLLRSSCFGTLLAVMRTLTLPVVQVAVIVLVIAAAVIVWWLMSRRRRFGTVDVADLFEVVEVGTEQGQAPALCEGSRTAQVSYMKRV